jgi:hypothetical protein
VFFIERELHVEIRALGGAARRVVLRIEIQDELAAAGARELEAAAAGAGKTEVRDRLAEHFQSFLCLF